MNSWLFGTLELFRPHSHFDFHIQAKERMKRRNEQARNKRAAKNGGKRKMNDKLRKASHFDVCLNKSIVNCQYLSMSITTTHCSLTPMLQPGNHSLSITHPQR